MRRPMRVLPMLVCVATLLIAATGCGGDDDEAAATTAETETTSAARDKDVALAVFERSYSECASFAIQRLSAKYKVKAQPRTVSLAVASAWAREFDGGELAVRRGRDGCLQGMRDRAGETSS